MGMRQAKCASNNWGQVCRNASWLNSLEKLFLDLPLRNCGRKFARFWFSSFKCMATRSIARGEHGTGSYRKLIRIYTWCVKLIFKKTCVRDVWGCLRGVWGLSGDVCGMSAECLCEFHAMREACSCDVWGMSGGCPGEISGGCGILCYHIALMANQCATQSIQTTHVRCSNDADRMMEHVYAHIHFVPHTCFCLYLHGLVEFDVHARNNDPAIPSEMLNAIFTRPSPSTRNCIRFSVLGFASLRLRRTTTT